MGQEGGDDARVLARADGGRHGLGDGGGGAGLGGKGRERERDFCECECRVDARDRAGQLCRGERAPCGVGRGAARATPTGRDCQLPTAIAGGVHSFIFRTVSTARPATATKGSVALVEIRTVSSRKTATMASGKEGGEGGATPGTGGVKRRSPSPPSSLSLFRSPSARPPPSVSPSTPFPSTPSTHHGGRGQSGASLGARCDVQLPLFPSHPPARPSPLVSRRGREGVSPVSLQPPPSSHPTLSPPLPLSPPLHPHPTTTDRVPGRPGRPGQRGAAGPAGRDAGAREEGEG